MNPIASQTETNAQEAPVLPTPFVDLRAQLDGIRDEIFEALHAVVETTGFIGGPNVKGFEDEFAAYCGAAHCIGVGNGTDAIYLALRALGIGQGDEVITAANSFIATSEAITMTGARVVFADCDPVSYNLDPQALEAAITERTRAVVPVHLYGQPANMSSIMEIARSRGLKVIEDASQAHGGEVAGRRVGTLADAACFSFYPGKNLGAYGDAGAVVTDNDDLARRVRMTANHGRIAKYDHEFEGVNSRLDSLQAAVLRVKLRHIEEWTEQRRRAAALYDELLAGSEMIATPSVSAGVRHVYHLYVVRVADRERVQAHLKARGISTGIHYPIALPELSAYRYLGHSPGDFPVASASARNILSLPMFPEITTAQVTHVCRELRAAVGEARS